MNLSPVMQKFILHWGEMGTRWGINRTVAQVYALLYLSPDPLNAEDITTTLSVARSNVSTSLKELQTWGIIKVVHVLGDRRDHFTATKDVWETFQKPVVSSCVRSRFGSRRLAKTTTMSQSDWQQWAKCCSSSGGMSKRKPL